MSESRSRNDEGIGHYIKQWRERRGKTQEQLAAAIGMSQGWIAQLESGTIAYSQKRLEELGVILDCSPADLISLDPTGLKDDQIDLVRQIVRMSKAHSPEVVEKAFQLARALLETND
ncbi:helix-turn-helix domain-containing protein [Pleomorphomonas oryzae]|uniref:helix-turn-helix domain-containing protein n=1 Tax=Pleomorphomonas oryzae TaxID=261934 RepID=UPI000687CDFC|nr:helix-turn-helix transcriptional regulator [Pleomorphomonas oryzae]